MDILRQSNLRALVTESLLSIGGKKRSEHIAITCPWHSETKPSLYVHIGHKVIPGSFHCFGCSVTGSWNKLAKILNLPLFEYEQKRELQNLLLSENDYNPNDYYPLDIVLKDLKSQIAANSVGYKTLKGTEELPDDFYWRGYSKKFYERLGGKFYWNNDKSYLYFPLHMNKKYMGYTLCNLDNSDIKYQTMTDSSKVFFLYDYIPYGEPIVLVEGHFDALRLYAEGFFPLALFGVQNWSAMKMNYLIAKAPPKIVIAMDGDNPGYTAAVNLFKDLRVGCNVDIFYLPIHEREHKIDPGNMSEEFLFLLRDKIYE